jgi:hypothetical protein
MVVKLSNFLSTNFVPSALDSADVVNIMRASTIGIDSNTTGDYISTLTAGSGISITGAGSHAATATVAVDSAVTATLSSTQTLTNKTINLSNNTLVTTLGQLNAAVSGANLVSINGVETLTSKTLTSPTINTPSISAGSITDITTFGLRDVTTTAYETRIRSNNGSPILTADRTLTLDVNDADRNISLTGNLTLGGNFTTSGAHATTLTTSGTTALTLPTSGTVISKDGSGNFTIAGTMTGEVDRSANTSVVAGAYGSATAIPVITVDANGFVDSVGTAAVSGVTGVSFNDTTGVLTVQTAIENFSDSVTLQPFTTSNLTEGTNLYYTDARVDSRLASGNIGNLIVGGNLTVNGTTTTINSTTLEVDDKNIVIASGTADSASANGAGITVDTINANIIYTSSTNSWDFNRDIKTNQNVVLNQHSLNSQTATTTTTSQTAVATFSATDYGSAEAIVTVKDGTSRHIVKLLIVHNGTTASATEFGQVTTAASLAEFDVDISGGNVRLLATSASVNSTVYNVALTLIDA